MLTGTVCRVCVSTLPSPENAHGGVGGDLCVGLVHKYGLKAGVRVAAGQDFLIELKHLVQVGHGVLEQREQLRQAEMSHLNTKQWDLF